MSFVTGLSIEPLYVTQTAATAKASFTSEITINDQTTGGLGAQANLPPNFWQSNHRVSRGVGFYIYAAGIVSSTGTPTYTWTLRLGTAGSTSAAEVLSSAAIASASGVGNVPWYFEGHVFLETLAAAGANSTVRGTGKLTTDSYSAATTTRVYQLYGTHASPGTNAAVDTSITNYINFNITCQTSSSSNTITLQQLLLYGI